MGSSRYCVYCAGAYAGFIFGNFVLYKLGDERKPRGIFVVPLT